MKQARSNSDVQFSRKMNKAKLYDLYVSLQSTNLSPRPPSASNTGNRQSRARSAPNPPQTTTPFSTRTRSGSLRPSSHSNRPSASLGRSPEFTDARPQPPPNAVQHIITTDYAAAMAAAGPSGLSSASQPYPPMVSNPFLFRWPPAPVADTSARLPLLAAHDQAFQQVHPTISNPSSFQWPAAPVAQTSTSQPPLAAQAHMPHFHPSFPSYPPPNCPYQTLEGNSSMRPPPTSAAPAHSLPSSFLQTKSQHSLFSIFSASILFSI